MRRHLEFLDRVKLQRLADPVSEFRPDAGHRPEQCFRAGAYLEMLEESPPAGREHFSDCAGDGSAEPGNRLKRFAPAPLDDGADLIVQHADRFGGSSISGGPKRAGALHRQDVGGLPKLVGDLSILATTIILIAPSRNELRFRTRSVRGAFETDRRRPSSLLLQSTLENG
jgi:hypothetical protein